MPRIQPDPYESYTIAQWKWEFLRRNPQYREAYRLTESLKGQENGQCFWFGRSVRFLELVDAVRSHCGLDPEVVCEAGNSNDWSLPNPDWPAHRFKICPVIGTRVYLTPKDFAWIEEPYVIDQLPEHELLVTVDVRSTLDEIFSDLKAELAPHLVKQKKHVENFKWYLAVWDLRQQKPGNKKLSADAVAAKVWPEEWSKFGGRDDTGWKSHLIQRVYDHEKKAEELIKNSFQSRKLRSAASRK